MKNNYVIVAGDLHLSNNLPWSQTINIHGRTDRLLEQIKVVKKIIKYINKHKAIFIFLGDLIDNRTYDSVILTELIDCLNKFSYIGRDCYFLAGNHDYDTKGREISCFNFLQKVYYGHPNMHFIDQPILMFNDSRKIIMAFVPYIHDQQQMLEEIDGFANNIKEQKQHNKGYQSILALHGDVFKAQWEHRQASGGLKLDSISNISAFDYILAGHVHVKQNLALDAISDRPKQAFYTGSLVQKNIGEANFEKGFYILDLNTGKKILVKTNSDFTNFFIVKTKADLKEALKLKNKHIIEVRLGVGDNIIDKLKLKHKVLLRATKVKEDIINDFEDKKQIIDWRDIIENKFGEYKGNRKNLKLKHKEIIEEIK